MFTPYQVFRLAKLEILFMIALEECDIERMQELEAQRIKIIAG